MNAEDDRRHECHHELHAPDHGSLKAPALTTEAAVPRRASRALPSRDERRNCGESDRELLLRPGVAEATLRAVARGGGRFRSAGAEQEPRPWASAFSRLVPSGSDSLFAGTRRAERRASSALRPGARGGPAQRRRRAVSSRPRPARRRALPHPHRMPAAFRIGARAVKNPARHTEDDPRRYDVPGGHR